MSKWLKKAMAMALCAAFALAACGDDDKSTSMGSERESTPQLPPEAVQVTGVLVSSFQTAFFASLLADTTSVPGVTGSVEIQGNNWTLQDFSPEGTLVLNGNLLVGKEQFPTIPVSGTIEVTGAQESTMILDMVVGVDGTDLSVTGMLTIDDVEFNIAELVDAANADADAAAAAEGG